MKIGHFAKYRYQVSDLFQLKILLFHIFPKNFFSLSLILLVIDFSLTLLASISKCSHFLAVHLLSTLSVSQFFSCSMFLIFSIAIFTSPLKQDFFLCLVSGKLCFEAYNKVFSGYFQLLLIFLCVNTFLHSVQTIRILCFRKPGFFKAPSIEIILYLHRANEIRLLLYQSIMQSLHLYPAK